MKNISQHNHDFVVVEEVSKLMDRGFTCYVEEEIFIGPSRKTKRGYRAVVDIYAVRGNEEIIIEVGTLSVRHGDRLSLLHKLKPNAKIIHVHQWKNYGVNDYRMWMLHYEWKSRNYFYSEKFQKESISEMGRALS